MNYSLEQVKEGYLFMDMKTKKKKNDYNNNYFYVQKV